MLKLKFLKYIDYSTKTCQIYSRSTNLIVNWWSLYLFDCVSIWTSQFQSLLCHETNFILEIIVILFQLSLMIEKVN
jgi:hypothetical protein